MALTAGDSKANAKKPKLDDSVTETEFDEETQKALEEIDGCQNEIDAMNEKASEEILSVERKYNKLRRPFFDKRAGIISRIPKFWLTSLINHPQLSTMIEEDEEDCLQYLEKLEVEEFEDIKSGFKLQFSFAENPYFSTNLLSKEFRLEAGDPTSSSTEIVWKDGYNLVEKAEQRAAMGKGGKKRHLVNTSFFKWFTDNQDPSQDEVAEVIKDDLWPNPLQYFLVPDIEVENGGEEEEEDEDVDDEEDENQEVVTEEEEEEDEEGEEGDDQ